MTFEAEDNESGPDWLAAALSFVFAAVPAWIVVAVVVWKSSPYMAGGTVLLIATGVAFMIGGIAGALKGKFWNAATEVARHTRPSRVRKHND